LRLPRLANRVEEFKSMEHEHRARRSRATSHAILHRALFFISTCILALSLAAAAHGWPSLKKAAKKLKPSHQPNALDSYLARARQWQLAYTPTAGSLWNPDGYLADLTGDEKARRVGDMVTIQLAESTSSALQQSAQTQRTFNASSGISAFFGNLKATNRAQNLFTPSSSQVLNGKGQTALATNLSTTLEGNVVEVLPNNLMVVEARRDVKVTDQKQTVILRGIIRRSDLSPTNSVISTAMSHLEVEVVGKGVITEGTHPPNGVIRVMLRILGF